MRPLHFGSGGTLTQSNGKWYNTGVMCMLDTMREKRGEIYELVRKYKGDDVYVFGSCARKEETPDSDIDLMITFNGTTLFDLVGLGDGLEKLLGRKVDLLSSRMVKNDRFGREVMKDRVAI